MNTKQENNLVLIVDDDQDNRQVLTMIMKSEGYYATEVAVDGREALAKMKEAPGKYAVVLLDLMMPVIDGYQVLRVMRAESELKEIPVIVITAVSKRESVKHCVALGALDYVLKPFEREAVSMRVRSALVANKLRDAERTIESLLHHQQIRKQKLLDVILPKGLSLLEIDDRNSILERITRLAMGFCHAQAGILYLYTPGRQLGFEVVCNEVLELYCGGSSEKRCLFPPLPIKQQFSGEPPGKDQAAVYAAYTGQQLNYSVNGAEDSLSSGIFDPHSAFQPLHFLVTPLINLNGEVIGVLELINASIPEDGRLIPFSEDQSFLINAFSRLAAAALVVVK